ncbi:MAG: serine/threonine-protein kinase, partial [Chitinivibrionales bacterium]|nr:serine/threonine-protein kinase [Chitinivibrionales bacterium]
PAAIGRYRIIKLLGSGAMGKVYLANDPLLERNIALKVIAIDPGLRAAARDEYLARFALEAKASAKLSHPSIVQIFDVGEDRGNPWIVFQLIKGESLEALLAERRKLTLRRAVLFALDIAAALQQAHSWNIVHRDVKPANILIEQASGKAMLSDFGIVVALGGSSVSNGVIVGSPGYMAPEQIDGRAIDGRADLFALGIVLYLMLTGEHPFLRPTMEETFNAVRAGDYKGPAQLVPDLPKAVNLAVRRCLYPDLRMRISSAAELIDILQPVVLPERHAAPAVAAAISAPTPSMPESFLHSLKTGRWHDTWIGLLQKGSARLAGRADLFTGENLENIQERISLVKSRVATAIKSVSIGKIIDKMRI